MILYESDYRKRKTTETVKRSVDARGSGGIEAGWTGGTQWLFRARDTSLYDTRVMHR